VNFTRACSTARRTARRYTSIAPHFIRRPAGNARHRFHRGASVLDVIDEDERIAHRMASPWMQRKSIARLTWTRRLDHMQQHTGQHLLSAVFIEQFGIETISFHLGQEISTLDLETPAVDMAKVIARGAPGQRSRGGESPHPRYL